ncbi:MAG: hypothetical protein ACD_5C00355G0001 [uncultured bacterium]|nr:MAG: hypothetical protein ACD_5C00355G0001 [uncultured bacterium]
MKFETGIAIEEAELQVLRKTGIRIPFWQLYREFNRQDLPKLLEKRKKENKTLAQSSIEKLERLMEAEKNGVLFMK